MYESNMKDISRELLDIKYAYLFEYRPMELYATEMEMKIVPKEAEYDENEKQKKDLMEKVRQYENEYLQTIQEIKLAQQTYREELKETDSSNEVERSESMRQYILLNKQLLEMKQTHQEMIEFKQSTTKKKQKPVSIEVTDITQTPLPDVIIPTINNNVVKKRLSQKPVAEKKGEEKEELMIENRHEEKNLPYSLKELDVPLNSSPESLESLKKS
jgi:NAD-specific glutamate dehydrogenase